MTISGGWLNAAHGVSPVNAFFVVLAGPGAGQVRRIRGFDGPSADNITHLDLYGEPLDGYVVANRSIVAITARTGQRAIVGNHFIWAEVVQFYG